MPGPNDKTTQEIDKKDAPMSIRESIMAAKSELEEGPDDVEDNDTDKEEEVDLLDEEFSDDPAGEGILNDDKPGKKKEAKKVESSENQEEVLETSEEDKEPEVKDTKKPAKKTKIAAPENWKDATDWDNTPASVRERIIKREGEVSEGFKQYGQKARAFDEYEQVIGPRRQSMAKVGVSPVQVIGRALDWMDALGHPDPKIKGDSFKLLARNFGIDINQLADVDNSGGESFRVAADGTQTEIPQQVQGYIQQLESRIAGFEQQLGGVVHTFQSQQDRNAMAYLQDWAKDKPYFQSVQSKMVELIQSGTVPLKEGNLDLDSAYKMACEANPQIKRLIELEESEKTRNTAKAKADSERKKKQQQAQSARSAASSLKTGASSASFAKNDPRGLSVRDTIKLSQRQLNGAN